MGDGQRGQRAVAVCPHQTTPDRPVCYHLLVTAWRHRRQDVVHHRQDVVHHRQDVVHHRQDVVHHRQDVVHHRQDVMRLDSTRREPLARPANTWTTAIRRLSKMSWVSTGRV